MARYINNIWYKIKSYYFYLRYDITRDFYHWICNIIWVYTENEYDNWLNLEIIEDRESKLTLEDVFPKLKNLNNNINIEYFDNELIEGINRMKLLTAPITIEIDEKEKRKYLCTLCSSSYVFSQKAIFCCVSKNLNPYKIGDIITLSKKSINSNNLDNNYNHWIWKLDESKNISYPMKKTYPYFVITDIVYNENIIEEGKISVKYHMETKSIKNIFRHGFLNGPQMKINGANIIRCPIAKIVEESEELIGKTFSMIL